MLLMLVYHSNEGNSTEATHPIHFHSILLNECPDTYWHSPERLGYLRRVTRYRPHLVAFRFFLRTDSLHRVFLVSLVSPGVH